MEDWIKVISNAVSREPLVHDAGHVGKDSPCTSEDDHSDDVLRLFNNAQIQTTSTGDKTEAGLRVIKNPDLVKDENWKENSFVGTVVAVLDGGKVAVLWDDKDDIDVFSTDKNELRIFDNAQIGETQWAAYCDVCKEYPIRGMRWKCLTCQKYDLCTKCYMSDKHKRGHLFERFQRHNYKGVEMPPRNNSPGKYIHGIFENSEVVSRIRNNKTLVPDGMIGIVEKIDHQNVLVLQSDAVVKWENTDFKLVYRVGREGKCDLKFTKPSLGPFYYEEHLPSVSRAIINIGSRVMKDQSCSEDDVDGGDGFLGTITAIAETTEINLLVKTATKCFTPKGIMLDSKGNSTIHNEKKTYALLPTSESTLKTNRNADQEYSLTIQWDNGNVKTYETKQGKCDMLKIFSIFGNQEIETDWHCDECDQTICETIWICRTCTCRECSLCTRCYMTDRHEKSHVFQRVIQTAKESFKTDLEKARSDLVPKRAKGIFKDAEVEETRDNGMKNGKVQEMRDYSKDTGRSLVKVRWRNGETTSLTLGRDGNCDLKLVGKDDQYCCVWVYYKDLPILGKDIGPSCIDMDIMGKGRMKTKIRIETWEKIEKMETKSFNPRLYFIFAKQKGAVNTDEENENDLRDVIAFSRKTRCFSHFVDQKVLLPPGNVQTAFIHPRTSKDTLKCLVRRGFKIMKRGNVQRKAHGEDDESEIQYFKRLADCFSQDDLIPVVILLGDGKFQEDVLDSAAEFDMSLLGFKRESSKISIYTPEKSSKHIKRYQCDMNQPWIRILEKNVKRDFSTTDFISTISEINLQDFDLESIICHVLICGDPRESIGLTGLKHPRDNCKGNVDILCTMLLKSGKWNIPKDFFKHSINLKALDYIYRKDLSTDYLDKEWNNLQGISNAVFKAPIKIRKDGMEGFDIPEKRMLGIVFNSLLWNRYYAGASQLVEKGYINIPEILVGCVILQDMADDWKTNNQEDEQLLTMKKSYTHHALRITSCIYDEEIELKMKNAERGIKDDECLHSGRLLLNHQYLRDAIKTQNKTFMDDGTVTEILNTLWYGNNDGSISRRFVSVLLVLFHWLLMPFIMIYPSGTIQKRLFREYNIPSMKVMIDVVGFLVLLLVYAYMLLFDYKDSVSKSDFFIIAWMVSFFLDESKHLMVSVFRKRFELYLKDKWNALDWSLMLFYALGMLLKFGDGIEFHTASKMTLVLVYILFSIRVLRKCCMSKILGPKLIMIRKMFTDTYAFMIIMTVLMICYSVTSYSLLHPNSDFTLQNVHDLLARGYWMLFGELDLYIHEENGSCLYNDTNAMNDRCASMFEKEVESYLQAFYCLVAIIMLLNLLIAMYGDTYSNVQEEAEFHWSQLQTDFLEDSCIKTIFPIHLQLLAMPICFLYFLIWCCKSKCNIRTIKRDFATDDEIIDKTPLFVRVFLYDTNFDLRLKSTVIAEENATMNTRGKLDVMESEKIAEKVGQVMKKQTKKIEQMFEKHTANFKQFKCSVDDNMKNITNMLQSVMKGTNASQYLQMFESMCKEEHVSEESSTDTDELS